MAGLAEVRVLIPDTAFPLTGYRFWRVRDGLLVSLNGTVWPPGKPVEAFCDRHDAPGLGCVCGLYGALRRPFVRSGEVWGTVEGWGRYVRHSGGWRAQFARVTGLASGTGAVLYDVPLLSQADPAGSRSPARPPSPGVR